MGGWGYHGYFFYTSYLSGNGIHKYRRGISSSSTRYIYAHPVQGSINLSQNITFFIRFHPGIAQLAMMKLVYIIYGLPQSMQVFIIHQIISFFYFLIGNHKITVIYRSAVIFGCKVKYGQVAPFSNFFSNISHLSFKLFLIGIGAFNKLFQFWTIGFNSS